MCWWLYIDMNLFLFFPQGRTCKILTHWYFEACCLCLKQTQIVSCGIFFIQLLHRIVGADKLYLSAHIYNKLLHYSTDHQPKQVFKHVAHITHIHLTYWVSFDSWTLKEAPGTLGDGWDPQEICLGDAWSAWPFAGSQTLGNLNARVK